MKSKGGFKLSGIFWLSSYPKSGNTWARVFLSNYLSDGDNPVGINELTVGNPGFMRADFDEFVGIDSADLSYQQIMNYRPLFYEQLVAESDEPLFLKIHDKFEYNSKGEPIFSSKATKGVIFLVRNPLDIAVSLAHHRNKSLDEAIAFMEDEEAALVGPETSSLQLPQGLGTWSQHTQSWMKQRDLEILVVKYEDLIEDAALWFQKILEFCGYDINDEKLRSAIENSSFSELKKQESAQGFSEKQPVAQSFFRKGTIGSWREALNEQQINEIRIRHGRVMRQLGYLEPEKGS